MKAATDIINEIKQTKNKEQFFNTIEKSIKSLFFKPTTGEAKIKENYVITLYDENYHVWHRFNVDRSKFYLKNYSELRMNDAETVIQYILFGLGCSSMKIYKKNYFHSGKNLSKKYSPIRKMLGYAWICNLDLTLQTLSYGATFEDELKLNNVKDIKSHYNTIKNFFDYRLQEETR